MAQDIRRILETSRVIAVLGASDKPARAGHYVPAYLLRHGYRVLPVNPVLAGQSLFGVDVVERLDGLSEPVDLVDVFRHPAHLPGHLDEILAMNPLPCVVWLQQGIRHEPFAAALRDRGIEVVQDRCTLADHRALGIG